MVVRFIILTVFGALLAAPLAEALCEQQELAGNVYGTVVAHREQQEGRPPPITLVSSIASTSR